jgi:hypothetical protein
MRWVRKGNSLIIIGTPPQKFDLKFSQMNRVHTYEPLQYEPFAGIEFEVASGKLIEFCGPNSIIDLMKPVIPSLYYTSILRSKNLTPLLKVSSGRHGDVQLVSGLKRLDNGIVFFLPQFSTISELQTHQDRLFSLPERLGDPRSELPVWSAVFRTSEEKAAIDKIAELNEELSQLRDKVSTQQLAVDAAQTAKALFAGTGDAFAQAVCDALQELGFNVVPGPAYRADFIALYGGRLAVIETKGLDGPAREANLRQTERWVADIKSALSSNEPDRAADKDLQAYASKLSEKSAKAL